VSKADGLDVSVALANSQQRNVSLDTLYVLEVEGTGSKELSAVKL